MSDKVLDAATQQMLNMSDEDMARMSFTAPWQYGGATDNDEIDGDGWAEKTLKLEEGKAGLSHAEMQTECWRKFVRNPQVNTAVRGLVGRLTGLGFACTSGNEDVQKVINEIERDPRNRLYNYWPKYTARGLIESELFLLLTVHTNGFIEVDFIDPSTVGPGGTRNSGIIFHPKKQTMPVFYCITDEHSNIVEQIPSIFVAYFPKIVNDVRKSKENGRLLFNTKLQQTSKSRKKVYKPFGGYTRFIVSWDRGFVTDRAISYLRTTLEWLNHYENLKKYEIDHKKSSGSYLWTFKFTEPSMFKAWLSLSDADKRKTGIMAKKTPGGSLILPPGVELDVVNPTLSSISGQDQDIMDMISSGLNEPADIMTGAAKGTFASVKASRGPMSDRVSDEVALFERFLLWDFWASVFHLKIKLDKFPETIKVREAVKFGPKGEPVFENRPRKPEELITIAFPISETLDYKERLALMGVKNGPVTESLGVPPSEVARKLGFGSYERLRLQKATEDEKYPELVYAIDQESWQETVEGEHPKKDKKKKEKKEEKSNESK